MNILAALKAEASKLQQQLDTLNSAMKVLGEQNSVRRPKKRRMSASARARIAKAQKARWAKVRGEKRKG